MEFNIYISLMGSSTIHLITKRDCKLGYWPHSWLGDIAIGPILYLEETIVDVTIVGVVASEGEV